MVADMRMLTLERTDWCTIRGWMMGCLLAVSWRHDKSFKPLGILFSRLTWAQFHRSMVYLPNRMLSRPDFNLSLLSYHSLIQLSFSISKCSFSFVILFPKFWPHLQHSMSSGKCLYALL